MSLPSWLDEKGKISEKLFCDDIMTQIPIIYSDERFINTNGELGDDEVTSLILSMIKPYISSGIAATVKRLLEALKLICYTPSFTPSEDEIHLLNGMLKTDGTWTPGKFICVNKLNIEYDPNIWRTNYMPQHFLAFLSDLLESDDIVTLQEYLGYCLIPPTKGQAMLFLIGNGGEDKNRIGVILKEIFGYSMITGNFRRIESDKFFRSNLQNKLLMLDDDMQMKALSSTGCIKTIVTAEVPIDVESKGKQSRQVKLYSRILCFSNDSPKALYDKSDGFMRRLIILTAKPVSPNRVNDPNIADKFAAEKKKIFSWMFQGLQRLIGNNFKFTLSEKAKKNVTSLMEENCNIPAFLYDTNYIVFDADHSESTQKLYEAYEHWCKENALTILNQSTFSGWLKSHADSLGIIPTNHVPTRAGREVRGYKEITLLYTSYQIR